MSASQNCDNSYLFCCLSSIKEMAQILFLLCFQVIGDKKGSVTSSFLWNKEYQILDEIQSALKIPLKFIHVIRNPFDNIATIVLRKLDARTSARDGNLKVSLLTLVFICLFTLH